MKMYKNIKDKIRGSLIGGAIGGALGFSIEFLSYERITYEFSKPGLELEDDLSIPCPINEDR
jgi:ADP-ribosylglycohydrolase